MRNPPRTRLLAVVTVLSAAMFSAQIITRPTAAQTDPSTTLAPEPVTTLSPPTTVPATTLPVTTVPAVTAPEATTPPTTGVPIELTVPQQTLTTLADPAATPTIPTVAPIVTLPDETTTEATTTTETSTTTTTIDLGAGDATNDDATSETPPAPFIPILPGIAKVIRNPTLEKLLFKLTIEQRKIVLAAQAEADAAAAKVAAAEADIESIGERSDAIRVERKQLQASLDKLRATIRERGLRIYAGEQIAVLDRILRSQDVTALAREIDLVGQAQKNDADLIKQYEEQQRALDAQSKELEALATEKQQQLETLRAEQEKVATALAEVQKQLATVSGGAAIALGGFVFPVAGPVSFIDSFGAPRMVGTKYYHLHEGTDVFAKSGTPLVAVSRGVIAKKGVGILGGNKLWLVAGDGTQYYYAHLSAFAAGIDDGSIVEAGQVVGYVGNTGNALTTPSHLHFEIHPGGLGALNPYPILDAVRRSDLDALLKASAATAATTTTTAPPADGEARVGVGVSSEFAIEADDAGGAAPTVASVPGTTRPARRA